MVAVTADEVRKRLGLTSDDISDNDVMAFVDEVAAFLSDEIGRTLDDQDCTEGEANAIRNLATIYCYCHITGGSAVGLSFSLGDLSVSETSAPMEKRAQVQFLLQQVERFIKRERRFAPTRANHILQET
ncbi:MAG: hypothetical protein ACE5L6_01515 [Candidatus Bathyarchaeia archaeon]